MQVCDLSLYQHPIINFLPKTNLHTQHTLRLSQYFLRFCFDLTKLYILLHHHQTLHFFTTLFVNFAWELQKTMIRRFKGNSTTDQTNPVESQNDIVFWDGLEAKCMCSPIKMLRIFVFCLVGFCVFFTVSSVLKDSSSDGFWTLADARLPNVKPPQKGTSLPNLYSSCYSEWIVYFLDLSGT